LVQALTTDDLLTEVKDQCVLPTADGRLGSTEALANVAICKMASRVLRTVVADLLIACRQQRWVTNTSTQGDGTAAHLQSITSGTSYYAVPERALAAGVADVEILDASASPIAYWSAPEIPAQEAWRYRSNHGGWDSPYAYCWRDDEIELLPNPTSTQYSLRIGYPRGLLRLVPVASAARVASKTATVITTSAAVPSTWAASETLDVVRGGPNGQPRVIDIAGSSISGTSITITLGVPASVVAGDYVCLDGETCVPPVPDAVWPVLVDATSLEVLRALGDLDGIAAAERRAGESMRTAKEILSPRSRGASKKIVARGYGTRSGWG
jgi:hypothetical protein